MDQRVLEEGRKTEEGRLKIKRIKHLKRKNGILTLIKVLGNGTSAYIDLLCVLSLFGDLFGVESSFSPFEIICCIIISISCNKKISVDIILDKDYNNKEIVKLENEIYDEDKEELTK